MFLQVASADSRSVWLAVANGWQDSLEDNKLPFRQVLQDLESVERLSFLPFQRRYVWDLDARSYYIYCNNRLVLFEEGESRHSHLAVYDTSAVERKYELEHSLRWDGLLDSDERITHLFPKSKELEFARSLLKYVKKLASTNIKEGSVKLEGIPDDVIDEISSEVDVRSRVFDMTCTVSPQ